LPIIRDTTRVKRLVRRVPWVPWTFLRHYVYPLVVRGSSSAADAGRFFDDLYASSGCEGTLSDAATIGPTYDADDARLHYNAVEGTIIKALRGRLPDPLRCLLDVGSGSGHWIDFYRSCYGVPRCIALDLSRLSVESLERKYAGVPEVEARQGDIADPSFSLEQEIDLVNAIGVMFHIVQDERLEQALSRLRGLLAPEGLILVGGQFGALTRDVYFHEQDGRTVVSKRIRSLSWWRAAALRAGLQVVARHKTRDHPGILLPENNLLVLAHARRG